jgi:hypothetical protein
MMKLLKIYALDTSGISSDILLLFQAVFGCPLRYGSVFIPAPGMPT